MFIVQNIQKQFTENALKLLYCMNINKTAITVVHALVDYRRNARSY